MLAFRVTACGRISRILKANNSSEKKKKKRLVEIKSSHDVFKQDQFANLPFTEDLGNNGPKVYSVRSRPKAFKSQVKNRLREL